MTKPTRYKTASLSSQREGEPESIGRPKRDLTNTETADALVGLYILADSILGAQTALTSIVSALIETHPDPAALRCQLPKLDAIRIRAEGMEKSAPWMSAFDTTADEFAALLARAIAAKTRH